MKLMHDCVNEFTPDFHTRGRSSRAVKGRAVATADHRRCAPKAFLCFSGHREGATPVKVRLDIFAKTPSGA